MTGWASACTRVQLSVTGFPAANRARHPETLSSRTGETRRLVHAAALVACWLMLFGAPLHAAERRSRATERFPSAAGKRIVVDVGDVDVQIRSADVVDIAVTAELRISGVGAARAEKWIADQKPSFRDSEDELRILVGPQESVGVLGIGRFTSHARLTIVAPTHVAPDITTTGGAIEAHGDFPSAQPFRARTSTGDIDFTGAAASFDIRSSSGATRLDLFRSATRLFARTAAGRIVLEGGSGDVVVDTASGDVTLAGLSGSARVTTSTGHVSLEWDRLEAAHEVAVRSSSGKVRLVLPGGVQPRGRITTINGSIESDLPGAFSPSGDSFEFSGEGPMINVETASTPITVVSAAGGDG